MLLTSMELLLLPAAWARASVDLPGGDGLRNSVVPPWMPRVAASTCREPACSCFTQRFKQDRNVCNHRQHNTNNTSTIGQARMRHVGKLILPSRLLCL